MRTFYLAAVGIFAHMALGCNAISIQIRKIRKVCQRHDVEERIFVRMDHTNLICCNEFRDLKSVENLI